MNYLKACLSVILIWGISLQLLSQQVITGTVYTINKDPIQGVTVSQGNNNIDNATRSDNDGEFTLMVNSKDKKSIMFRFPGCVMVVITGIDTISHPLTIQMEADTSWYDNLQGYPPHNDHHKGYIITIGTEVMSSDFSKFESKLGSYNTDFMSGLDATLNLEFALTYKRFLAGIGAGISLSDNLNNDSLKVGFNTIQYNLEFGFKLLNSKRLTISPLIGLKWKRYRLTNSDIDRKIPIETYLSDKDLDIRFNQTYSSAGLRIEYKPKKQDFEYTYLSVGVDGGFILPLNKVPWTYSRKNRLLTDKELGIENYFFRFFLAWTIV